MKYSGEISYILENFEFDKVKKVMDFLDWQWTHNGVSEVPSIGKLVMSAKELLEIESLRAEELPLGEAAITQTGGFRVSACLGTGEEGEPRMYLSLSFQLESWDNYL